MQWAGRYYAELVRGDPMAPLWPFRYPQLLSVFSLATTQLHIPGTVAYQARHSGPSIDRSKDLRSLADCKKRGRWASWRSVTRYEKSARLSEAWGEIPAATRDAMMLCEKHLGEIVSGRLPVPAGVTC